MLLAFTETGVCLVSCGGGIRFQCMNVQALWTHSQAYGWPLKTLMMRGRRLQPCWVSWSLMCWRCAKMLMFWIPGSLQPYCHSLHLAGLKRCENQNCITCFCNIYCVFLSVLFNFYLSRNVVFEDSSFLGCNAVSFSEQWYSVTSQKNWIFSCKKIKSHTVLNFLE